MLDLYRRPSANGNIRFWLSFEAWPEHEIRAAFPYWPQGPSLRYRLRSAKAGDPAADGLPAFTDIAHTNMTEDDDRRFDKDPALHGTLYNVGLVAEAMVDAPDEAAAWRAAEEVFGPVQRLGASPWPDGVIA